MVFSFNSGKRKIRMTKVNFKCSAESANGLLIDYLQKLDWFLHCEIPDDKIVNLFKLKLSDSSYLFYLLFLKVYET